MTLHANVTCPACMSEDCRKSGWRSDGERQMNPGLRPYRCRACHHRFWAPRESSGRRFGFSAGALPLLIIAIGVFWVFGEPRVDDQAAHEPVPAATAIDPHTLRAAQEGNAEAQVRIAKVLLFGGVQAGEQATEAVRWLQSAAEKNHPAAMVMLGKLYRSGFGVLQDYGQAVKWIRTAAERGDPDGMLELGRLYRDGLGIPRDPVLAYVWFNRAAAALQVDAVRHRADVARGLTPEQLKAAQAQSSALEVSQRDAKVAKDGR
ncbi:hypothetical protein AzCIB_3414 [Azoarcus sp. CIB]|nr:hypothetical protein AzCIB_3414 [Azoarcus sp. CIB]